jgi:putative endonuclease
MNQQSYFMGPNATRRPAGLSTGSSRAFLVYVLVSATTGKRYIGQTDDLERRLSEHNNPTHNVRKYTSRHAGLWRLVHSEGFSTRPEAMRHEKFLKSGAGRAWLDREIGRASPPEAD